MGSGVCKPGFHSWSCHFILWHGTCPLRGPGPSSVDGANSAQKVNSGWLGSHPGSLHACLKHLGKFYFLNPQLPYLKKRENNA